MEFINNLFGIPLGYLMWPIYHLVKDYGVALILFTLVTKILLFPLSVKQQQSMAKTTSLQPKLAALQKKYGNNKQKMQEEQMKLYSEEGVNPMGSCLPLLIQMPILFGIIDVVYRPMTHVLHIPADMLSKAVEIAKDYYTAAGTLPGNFSGFQEQLYTMQAYAKSPESFAALTGFADKVGDFSMIMLGSINLGDTPTFTWPIMLIPILAGLSQLAMTVYSQRMQKKMNPSAPSMASMNIMMYGMPLFSIWMAFSLPAGVGFYWFIQSLFSFGQSVVLYRIYTPERIAKLVEKDRQKKKSKGPTYMQRVMEQQQAMTQAKNGSAAKVDTTAEEKPAEEKVSKSAQKDMSSKVIAEARRRYAEKYGDEVDGE